RRRRCRPARCVRPRRTGTTASRPPAGAWPAWARPACGARCRSPGDGQTEQAAAVALAAADAVQHRIPEGVRVGDHAAAVEADHRMTDASLGTDVALRQRLNGCDGQSVTG